MQRNPINLSNNRRLDKRRRRLGDPQTTSCTQGLSRLLFELKPDYIFKCYFKITMCYEVARAVLFK